MKLLYSFITTFQNYLQSTVTEIVKDQYMTSKETTQTSWRLKIENTGQVIRSCELNLAYMSYTPNQCSCGFLSALLALAVHFKIQNASHSKLWGRECCWACLSVCSAFRHEMQAEEVEWINTGVTIAEGSFNIAYSPEDNHISVSYQSSFLNYGQRPVYVAHSAESYIRTIQGKRLFYLL